MTKNIKTGKYSLFIVAYLTMVERESLEGIEPIVRDVAELHRFESQTQICPVPNFRGISWHPSCKSSSARIKLAITELKHPRIVSPCPYAELKGVRPD